MIEAFPELLKAYRLNYDISQSRLAERIGWDHSFVSRLESGERSTTREAVLKIAEALQLTPDKRDRLLASAGFMPQDPLHLFTIPELARLEIWLPKVAPEIRDDIRATLRTVLRSVGAATG